VRRPQHQDQVLAGQPRSEAGFIDRCLGSGRGGGQSYSIGAGTPFPLRISQTVKQTTINSPSQTTAQSATMQGMVRRFRAVPAPTS